jgi:hypothetical protein
MGLLQPEPLREGPRAGHTQPDCARDSKRGRFQPGHPDAGRTIHRDCTQQDWARYQLGSGGWRFRYIATTLTVPASTTGATNASITLWNDNDAISRGT